MSTIAVFHPPLGEAGPCVSLLLACLDDIYPPLARWDCSDNPRAAEAWKSPAIAWAEIKSALIARGQRMNIGNFFVDCDAATNHPSYLASKTIGLKLTIEGMPAAEVHYLGCRLRRLGPHRVGIEILPSFGDLTMDVLDAPLVSIPMSEMRHDPNLDMSPSDFQETLYHRCGCRCGCFAYVLNSEQREICAPCFNAESKKSHHLAHEQE